MQTTNPELPLHGIKVIEFTHMVMGPATGMILADLGADVIKVEPPGGDHTRRLTGSGAGYFTMFNRNKRSICLDLKNQSEVEIALALCKSADIVIENFKPGTLARLGLGYERLRALNPRLIFCSDKGFLTGPYQHRTALDEVAQMMGGLAYMTGPVGQPLRAGSSVIDITGGMFGVIGVLAALERRHRTGEGAEVKSALYETTAFLVGQHMAQKAVTGTAAQPMPERLSAWAIYDVFETAEPNQQLFVGVVSDGQWSSFCTAFALHDLGADPAYATNNQRVQARSIIVPRIRALFAHMSRDALITKLESIGLPFAPIMRPDDLLTDPHLLAGGMVDVNVPGGVHTKLPGLPIELDGGRLALRRDVPLAGQDSSEILRELGYEGSMGVRAAP